MKIPGLRHSAEEVGGLVFFGRTLDKIRLHSQGKLPTDYNRGTGFDGRVCRFLCVEYPSLVERVLEGGSDEEINYSPSSGLQQRSVLRMKWSATSSPRRWSIQSLGQKRTDNFQ